jgi:hypothetical protein
VWFPAPQEDAPMNEELSLRLRRELGWGRVAATLTTHAAGGLPDNDFILAAKLDRP